MAERGEGELLDALGRLADAGLVFPRGTPPPGTIAMSLKALAVGGHVSVIGASLSRSGTGLDPLLLTASISFRVTPIQDA